MSGVHVYSLVDGEEFEIAFWDGGMVPRAGEKIEIALLPGGPADYYVVERVWWRPTFDYGSQSTSLRSHRAKIVTAFVQVKKVKS